MWVIRRAACESIPCSWVSDIRTEKRVAIMYAVKKMAARIDPDLREVMSGAFISFALKIVGMAAAFAVSVVVARTLTKDGAGLYFLSISVITILSTVGRLGFENTVVRFVASNAAESNWSVVRSVYEKSMGFVLTGSLVISAVLFLTAGTLANRLFGKPDAIVVLRIASCTITPTALLMIQGDALRGLKWIISSQFVKRVSLPTLTLVLLYPMIKVAGVGGAVGAYSIAGLLTLFGAHVWWKRTLPKASRNNSSPSNTIHLKQLAIVSLPIFGYVMCGLIMQQAGTVLVGIWGSAASVSNFSVAQRTANLLLLPLLAAITILAPKFAAMAKLQQWTQLEALTRRSLLFIAGTGIPVCVILYVFSRDILSVFGPTYVPASNLLHILIIGIFASMISGPTGTLLTMAGYEKDCLVAGALAVVAFVTLAVVTIPSMGARGAAFATALAMVVQNVILFLYCRRHMGFWLVPAFR